MALSSFVLLGAGCAVTHYPLETDELGHAAICIWNEKKEPTHCVYDKTRYTIDIEAYEQLQDRLARQKRELYDKRRL